MPHGTRSSSLRVAELSVTYKEAIQCPPVFGRTPLDGSVFVCPGGASHCHSPVSPRDCDSCYAGGLRNELPGPNHPDFAAGEPQHCSWFSPQCCKLFMI